MLTQILEIFADISSFSYFMFASQTLFGSKILILLPIFASIL